MNITMLILLGFFLLCNLTLVYKVLMAIHEKKLKTVEGLLTIALFMVCAYAFTYIVLEHGIRRDPVSQYHHNECVQPPVPQSSPNHTIVQPSIGEHPTIVP